MVLRVTLGGCWDGDLGNLSFFRLPWWKIRRLSDLITGFKIANSRHSCAAAPGSFWQSYEEGKGNTSKAGWLYQSLTTPGGAGSCSCINTASMMTNVHVVAWLRTRKAEFHWRDRVSTVFRVSVPFILVGENSLTFYSSRWNIGMSKLRKMGIKVDPHCIPQET